MLSQYKELLNSKIEDLCNKMNPEKVVSEMMKYPLFYKEHEEKIKACSTTMDKNEKLVNILLESEFGTFSEFLRSLSSIDKKHLALAEAIQPVKFRILWFSTSPTHAASVVHVLEKCAKASFSKMQRIGSDSSLILRRSRLFKKEYFKEDLMKKDLEAQELVRYSHEVEVCLVFPSIGKNPIKSLETVFRERLILNLHLLVMGGLCREKGGSFVVSQVMDVKEGKELCAKPTDSDLTPSVLSQIRDAESKWMSQEALSFLSNGLGSLQIESCPMRSKGFTEALSSTQQAAASPSSSDPSLMFDSITFNFYSTCLSYFPDTRSLVCKSTVPSTTDTGASPSAVGGDSEAESKAAMASARALMNIAKYYYDCTINLQKED